jgi:hypothetical protein
MHRKREAATPAISARSNDNSKAPISVASKSQDGDGALLALERQFEVLVREVAILLRTSPAQNRKGTRDLGYDAASANPGNRGRGSCDLARSGDGAAGPPAKRLKHIEAALARLEPIERAILATPAETVVGLGVKARHAAYVISEYWAEPLEKSDWDRRAVRLLIEAVCVVAGQPLAMCEASEP